MSNNAEPEQILCLPVSMVKDIKLIALLLLNTTYPVLANSVGPDQLASFVANRSGCTPFVIKHVNFYRKPGSSNLICRKLEVGVAS